MKSKKKYTIIGNWKMNPDTLEAAKALFSAHTKSAKKYASVSVVIAAPAPFVSAFLGKDTPIHLGVQDVSTESRGAFTGQMSAFQAKSVGAQYTLIGHSEKRMAGDTDDNILKKTVLALEAGLNVVLCVGEKVRDEQAHYLRTIREQVVTVLSKIDKKKIPLITIAYEPIWAIGKSFDLAPKPVDVHEMAIYIKKVAAEALGKKDGLKIPIIYGGAVSSENAEAFLHDGGIDGLLVGRQSLDVGAFKTIIEHASKA